MKRETYIYSSEAISYFANKLRAFHEKFVDTLLLSGLDQKNTDIESIKFTKNPSYNLKYYQKIVGGIKNEKPSIKIEALDQEGLHAECYVTHLSCDKYINNPFFTQNVMNWGGSPKTCYQIWKLKETSLKNINNFWKE